MNQEPDSAFTPSRPVQSSQQTIHQHLRAVVGKHLGTRFDKPISSHTLSAFEEACSFVYNHAAYNRNNAPIIVDSCCGTGESTRRLAARFPEALVVGIDKSAQRIARFARSQSDKTWTERSQTENNNHPVLGIVAENETDETTGSSPNESSPDGSSPHHAAPQCPRNLLMLRADAIDFWRLAAQAVRDGTWRVARHFLLYPNPYPKPQHLLQRWHGHPVFPDVVALCKHVELRTNWRVYAEEFAIAWHIATGTHAFVEELQPDDVLAEGAMTAFERKYARSGHTLYRLRTA